MTRHGLVSWELPINHSSKSISISSGQRCQNIIVPSGYVKIAIENGSFIVDVPIKNGDFP